MAPDEKVLSDFLDLLDDRNVAYKTLAELTKSASHPSAKEMFRYWLAHNRRLYMLPRVGFIYVNIRVDPPGWWGLDEDVVNDLEQLTKILGLKHYYLLIVGRKDKKGFRGYLCSEFNEPPFTTPPECKNGKYNVYEKTHLNQIRGKNLGTISSELQNLQSPNDEPRT